MIKGLRAQAGYSMVEVLAAIVILSLAILPMVGMFDAGLRAAVLGGNYDKARSLANSNLETVKSLEYSEAVADYPPDASTSCPVTETGFTCEIDTRYLDSELAPDPNSRTRMQVWATVEWENGNKSYTATGLTAEGSL